MTNDKLRELNRSRKIYQVAFVTRDLERSMKAWVEYLGIGPWTVLTFTEETVRNFRVDEQPVTEPFKFLIGVTFVGGIQLEIIEPVYGNLNYWRHLETRGEGLHHIKEQIPDERIPEVIDEYRSKGIGVMQTGQYDIDVHFNLDTEEKLDFVLELGNCPQLELSEEMVSVYPPETVDHPLERV